MVGRIRRARVEQWSEDQLRDETVGLAAEMLGEAMEGRRFGEWYRGWKMDRMRGDATGRAFSFELIDQVMRPGGADRLATRLARLVERHGVPGYLPWHERGALLLAAETGQVLPEIVMPVVERVLRREARGVVGSGRTDGDGMRRSLNLPGEAVLGDAEAERRLAAHLGRLADPDCVCLSVKVGTLCGRINVLAYQDTLERIKVSLRKLYRIAMKHGPEGAAKLVHLDMDGFREVALTMDAFREVLEEREFAKLEAGIMLQAYLPESFPMQQELTEWASVRVADGGSPVRLRLVKGGNLSLERIEASRHGWEAAPYEFKSEVDANFKRMLHYACRPENAGVVRVGVGSHHLFDVAHTLLLRAREGVGEFVGLEMLEGMAGGQARVAGRLAGGMSLYAAEADDGDASRAISYLLRRLDESVAAEGFQRDLHGMVVGGKRWEREKERFLQACGGWEAVSCRSRRVQNREIEYPVLDLGAEFRNEPVTDWTREENRDWIEAALEEQRDAAVCEIRGGGDGMDEDPGEPGEVICRYDVVGPGDVEDVLAAADAAWRGWGAEVPDRRRLLKEAACGIGRERGRLIAVLVSGAGKPVAEADAEVCEAVDLANYYADSLWWPGLGDGVSARPMGVVAVMPSRDAPLATACGGVLAALMAGNAVVLAPSSGNVLAAWRLAEVLWEAGVPEELLWFLPVVGDDPVRALVTDERVWSVVLHGGSDMVARFMEWKPGMRLMAAVGGKNTMLITAAADRGQAVRDLARSAFGHAGQSASAVSLAIVEAEVLEDESFLKELRDAAASLPVRVAWDPAAVVTPLVCEPGGDLMRALTDLDEGEEWLLKPERLAGRLWSPGIRIGVRPESWFAQTVCGGPVLGVIRTEGFEEGMRIQNGGAFGLAGGLQSLDAREVRIWREKVAVGNAHVNRPVTGPEVRRRPGGGWKAASVGPGAMSGGPNHVLRFAEWREEALPTAWAERPRWMEEMVERLEKAVDGSGSRIAAAAGSDAQWWAEEFAAEHDPSAVMGESHVFRYRPERRVVCRVDGMSGEDIARVCLAARCCGVELALSAGDDRAGAVAEAAGVLMVRESEVELTGRLKGMDVLRMLAAGREMRRAAFESGVRVEEGAVLANGRLELPRYLREQSVSAVTHRHGILQ